MWTVIGGPYNSVFTGRRARRPFVAPVIPPVVTPDTPSGGFLFAPTPSRKEDIRKKRIKLGILPPDPIKVVEQPAPIQQPQYDPSGLIQAFQARQAYEQALQEEQAAHVEQLRQAQLAERRKRLMRFILLNS